MRLIRAATLTVSDLKRTQSLYCDWLNYTCVEDGIISQDLAESWGAPKTAKQPYCVLQPESAAKVYIRLIEQPAVKSYKALRSYGWAAIEICNQDTIAASKLMEVSPFEIIGPPKELDLMPEIFPMQVKGPDQEIIYLTEIRDDLEAYDLPRAESPIDKLFILVMACSDLEASGRWLEKHLLIKKGPTMNIKYSMINKAFNLPNDTKHALATLQHERDVFLEIDQYPEQAESRSAHEGMLHPCAAIGSFIHPDFDNLVMANKGHWISPPRQRAGVIYNNKRAGTLRAPDGTLIEMIEA